MYDNEFSFIYESSHPIDGATETPEENLQEIQETPEAPQAMTTIIHPQNETGYSNIGKRVLVIGVGNGGCRTIEYMQDKKLEHVRLLKMDTDRDSLSKEGVECFCLSDDGNGAGMKPEVAITRVKELQEEIHKLLDTADVIFLLSSLGGGTGSGGVPELARLAKNMNKHVIIIVNTPESCVSDAEISKANAAIESIEQEDLANALMVIPNDRLMTLLEDSDEIESYNHSYEVMYQAVYSLESLMNKNISRKIDFNDLQTILDYRGRAIFAAQKAKGESLQAIKEAFSKFSDNSIADHGELKSVKGMLFNIKMPSNITNKEKSCVCEETKKLVVKDEGHCKWNWHKDSSLEQDEIVLTVIVTGIDSNQTATNNNHTPKLNDDTQGSNPHVRGQQPPDKTFIQPQIFNNSERKFASAEDVSYYIQKQRS